MYAFRNGRIFGITPENIYNPTISLLTLNGGGDKHSMSLTDFLNTVKTSGRKYGVNSKWELLFEISGEPNKIYRLVCDSGLYAIESRSNTSAKEMFNTSNNKQLLYHPRISRKLFKMEQFQPEVLEYIKLLYGARPPKHFWKNLSSLEYMNILRYEALYVLDLDSRDKATHLVTNDLRHQRIPTYVKTERGFAIIDIAKIAFPDIKPWEMKTIPRGYAMDDDVLFAAIKETMVKNDIADIENLTRKILLENAPSILNKLVSMKSVVSFYKEYQLEGK